jgi:hypothetical protein
MSNELHRTDGFRRSAYLQRRKVYGKDQMEDEAQAEASDFCRHLFICRDGAGPAGVQDEGAIEGEGRSS